jgi:hypothetical protein
MPSFSIINVKGDGHCYYRCIYQIAKNNSKVKDALYIEDIDNEEEAIKEIRQYIATSLKCDKRSENILKNLIAIYKDVPEISQNYPILKKIDKNDTFKQIRDKIMIAIQDTNIYVSSFEHEIISERLSENSNDLDDIFVDIKLIILTKNYNEKKEDFADKWLRQLQPILKTVTNTSVSILINEDNVHYKYMKFLNQIIINKEDLQNYIEKILEESTDDESDEDDIIIVKKNDVKNFKV